MSGFDKRQQAVLSRPIWQPLNSVTHCKKCREEFGFFVWKHHCRGCGHVFCDKCTSNVIALPEDWGYDEKQRVCVKCMLRITKDQDLRRLTKEELLMLQFFLRESNIYRVRSKDITGIGSRFSPHKTPVLAEFKNPNNPSLFSSSPLKQDHIMTLMDTSLAPAPLTVQSKKKWAKILYSLEHPFIAPVLEADILTEKGRVVFFRELYEKGSLKDLINGCTEPLQSSFKKYPDRMKFDKYDEVLGLPDTILGEKCLSPLKLATIKIVGRQVLEGLAYLKRCKVPYPYLHTGNVLLTKKGVHLSDFENIACGLKPHYCLALPNTDPEVECFGNVLFEMAMGFPRFPNLMSRKKNLKVPKSCPPEVLEVLETIFSKDGGQTIEGLLEMPFFASVNLKLTEPLPTKIKGMTKGMAAYLQTYQECSDKIVQSVYDENFLRAKSYVGEKAKHLEEVRALNEAKHGSQDLLKRNVGKPGEQAIRSVCHSDSLDLPDDRRQRRRPKKSKSSQISSSPSSSSSPPSSSPPPPPPPPSAPAAPPPAAPAAAPPPAKGRGALLDSIRNPDTKLKKAKTVDKSIPKHLR